MTLNSHTAAQHQAGECDPRTCLLCEYDKDYDDD